MEPHSCVICHHPLPLNSKLITASVPPEEAGQNDWNGHKNRAGTVLVGMCLGCQVDRERSPRIRDLTPTLMLRWRLPTSTTI